MSNYNTNLTNNTSELQEVLEILQNKAAGGSTPVLQDKTATPTAITQIIEPDSGYDGLNSVTVTGDANLLPENIMSGVSIFGVEGNAEGGGGSSIPTASKKEVNFIDYDGTILYSYTVEEAQALTELPALPVREGLTCQGWNLSLDYIKTYSGKYGVCDVGAMYITDDGKTRLYIRIAAEGRMTVSLYASADDATIDWGDGSTTETLSLGASHTYASIGDYVITLEVTSGTLEFGDGWM